MVISMILYVVLYLYMGIDASSSVHMKKETVAEYFCGYIPLSRIYVVQVSNDEVLVQICGRVRVVFFNGIQWHHFFQGIDCPCSTRNGDQFSRGHSSCTYLIILGTTLFVMDGKHLSSTISSLLGMATTFRGCLEGVPSCAFKRVVFFMH